MKTDYFSMLRRILSLDYSVLIYNSNVDGAIKIVIWIRGELVYIKDIFSFSEMVEIIRHLAMMEFVSNDGVKQMSFDDIGGGNDTV